MAFAITGYPTMTFEDWMRRRGLSSSSAKIMKVQSVAPCLSGNEQRTSRGPLNGPTSRSSFLIG